MTTIDDNKKICTLINVFSVKPENHRDLFEHLKEATINVFGSIPGYISANLHVSDDQKTITNYAQWASKEEYLKAVNNEDVQHHMKKAASLATGFSPVLYNKIWTHQNEN